MVALVANPSSIAPWPKFTILSILRCPLSSAPELPPEQHLLLVRVNHGTPHVCPFNHCTVQGSDRFRTPSIHYPPPHHHQDFWHQWQSCPQCLRATHVCCPHSNRPGQTSHDWCTLQPCQTLMAVLYEHTMRVLQRPWQQHQRCVQGLWQSGPPWLESCHGTTQNIWPDDGNIRSSHPSGTPAEWYAFQERLFPLRCPQSSLPTQWGLPGSTNPGWRSIHPPAAAQQGSTFVAAVRPVYPWIQQLGPQTHRRKDLDQPQDVHSRSMYPPFECDQHHNRSPRIHTECVCRSPRVGWQQWQHLIVCHANHGIDNTE